MRIIDRYVTREVLTPFVLGLLVFTFILIIPTLVDQAESLIAKGVPALTVLQLMALLLPSALGLTIPMALLLGLLIGFGRLSADREFVALQACGVSLLRLLRPVALLSTLAFTATCYVMLWAIPSANQSFREILFNVVAARAEGEVRPRAFFDGFPDVVLYVRDIPPEGGGWNGVFLSDSRGGQQQSTIYIARRGRVSINQERQTVEMVLDNGERHTADEAGKYEVFQFERLVLSLNPESMFPKAGPPRGAREMSIAELEARAAELRAQGTYPHNELFEIQKKFSIPFACVVFGLIGLALGASNRRDGKLASFVVGLGVIFAYYVLLSQGQSLVKGQLVTPWLAAWLPNLVLGALGVALFVWRDRVADRPFKFTFAWRRREHATQIGERPVLPLRILDRYIGAMYIRILALSALALAGIFYISTFIELSEKVLKGDATWWMLLLFFWYTTPQYVYYIIPISVLLATLVTVGLLTKNSELVVMKACGISLYRVALPMVMGAVIAGAVLFGLEETVLGPANRRAETLNRTMRGRTPLLADLLSRRWILGSNGEIYNFTYFDPTDRRFSGLWVFEFDQAMHRLTRRTYARVATYAKGADPAGWNLESGWVREFADGEAQPRYAPLAAAERRLETPAYFASEQPEPRFMSYSQLSGYTERLAASGYDVLEQQVAVARKLSFPFVTLVMTLIAVPFAVTMGRSGALAGVGIGIGIALVYWVTLSVFAAFGAGGVMPPALAAWAPNLLFGAGAAYLLLTVRT